jgi:VWFA-related protein
MPKRSLKTISGVLQFLGMLLIGQTPLTGSPPQEQQQSPAVLRATTRLVQVSVIARDKKGLPVKDLTAEDFSILDEGRLQKIALFSAQDDTVQEAAKSLPLPPNVFTNRFDRTGHVPGAVTVILLDALNTSNEEQSYSRRQILKFLSQLKPQDHVAIYLLTSNLTVLQDFTFDLNALISAINQYTARNSGQLDAANPVPIELPNATSDARMKILQDFINTGMGKMSDTANENRALVTAQAIEAIAKHVSRIPGRKNLLWVSGSFPLSVGLSGYQLAPVDRERIDFSSALSRAARAVNDVNMAIYPVDVRGLMTNIDISRATHTAFDQEHLPGLGTPDEMNFDSMILLAQRTGGMAFHNTNDIAGAVRQAITDGEYTYTLSFYPNHAEWNGKFHELKVRLKNSGVSLRYRNGYFATPDPPSLEIENKEALNAAILSPIESVGMDMAVEVKPLAKSGPDVLRFVVGLDARQFHLEDKEGHRKGSLEVVFVQLDSQNKSISAEQRSIRLDYDEKTYGALLKTGLTLTRNLHIEPGTLAVRIAVCESMSGAIATVTVPLQSFQAVQTHPLPTPSSYKN